MGIKTKFVPNRAGIRELGRSVGMQVAMHRLAEDVAVRARLIAPVRTGRYRASITASSKIRRGRAVGVVTARAPYSAFLEFGTEKMRAQRILGRALGVLGERP